MAYASAPVILDSTGQNIATSLATLAANIAAMKGANGTAGVGVTSFVWYSNSGSDPQGTAGTIDTYRMTFTDGNHADVSVYNGANGLGALVWGNISGTLSDQTDLQAALNAKSDRPAHVAVTIDVADWSSKTCTKSVTGVTSSSNIIITPDPSDFLAYSNAQIRATAQGNGTVTFQCETTPNEAITVNVLIVWYPKYSTISGSLASFYTIASSPLDSFLVNVDAVQNLNGYSKPWAGGAGKNKVDISSLKRGDGSPRTGNEYVNIPAGTYTVSANNIGDCTLSIQLWSATENMVSKNFNVGQSAYTITVTNDIVRLYCYISTSNYNDGKYGELTNVQIEVGSEATAYEPYSNICPITGHTEAKIWHDATHDTSATADITVDMTSAGTVYGGTLDVLTGVLTVDRAAVVFNGSETWDYWNGVFVTYYSGVKRVNSESSEIIVIADRFKPNGVKYRASCGDGNIIRVVNTADQIACYSSAYADVNAFKTSLQSEPMTVVYKLANPFTVQLTVNQVNTLLGQNYIWADVGDVSVTYQIN